MNEEKEMEFDRIDTKPRNILAKRGITSGTRLMHVFPRRFYDLTHPIRWGITPEMFDKYACFEGVLATPAARTFPNDRAMTRLGVDIGGTYVSISFFGGLANFQFYQLKDIPRGSLITVFGKLKATPSYNQDRMFFSIDSPPYITNGKPDRKMVPVYDIKGISDDKMEEFKAAVPPEEEQAEYLPQRCLKLRIQGRNVPGIKDTLRMMTAPADPQELTLAKKRFFFEDMFYYACQLEKGERNLPKGSSIIMASRAAMNRYIGSLPYKLTKGQGNAIMQMVSDMEQGRRLQDILSADVGAGKTTIAFALMFAVCGNGHQAALCAPTESVAMQHYEKLVPFAEAQGMKAIYLSGGIKQKRRKAYRELLRDIADGTAAMIVGTHAVFSEDVVYKDLALVITDEEHSFGVEQKERFHAKGTMSGVHQLSMSATLLPRTLFTVMFSQNAKLLSVESVPQGRLPVQTDITREVPWVLERIRETVDEGSQVYVVCPLVSPSDAETMDGIANVEDTAKALRKYFPKEWVGKVTGKMKKEDAEKALRLFKDGTTKILVATTIISVGVDVPNATLMVIRSPERFGLATMHQTRGRVGRGRKQSYCILLSDMEKDTERLQYFQTHHNGAELAEQDAVLRGKGNYLGTEQSGNNKYISEIEEQPALFKYCRGLAKDMLDHDEAAVDRFLEGYEEFHSLDADVLAKEERKKERSIRRVETRTPPTK